MKKIKIIAVALLASCAFEYAAANTGTLARNTSNSGNYALRDTVPGSGSKGTTTPTTTPMPAPTQTPTTSPMPSPTQSPSVPPATTPVTPTPTPTSTPTPVAPTAPPAK